MESFFFATNRLNHDARLTGTIPVPRVYRETCITYPVSVRTLLVKKNDVEKREDQATFVMIIFHIGGRHTSISRALFKLKASN